MPTSFKIIATLLVVSGFIAWLGDVVGKRMGKKRLTILGLRPRKTGMIMSIVAGVLIQIFSIAALTVVSREAHTALFESDVLQRNNTRLRDENKKLEAQSNELKASNGDLSTKLTSTTLALRTTGDELTKKTATLVQKRKEIERLQTLQRELERRMRTVQARMETVQGRLQQVQKQYERTNSRLRDANKSLQASETAYRDAYKKYQAAQVKYQEVQDELNRKLGDLETTKAKLETTKKTLEDTRKEVAQAEKELNNAQRILGDLQTKADDYQKQSETLAAALKRLRDEYESLEKLNANLREDQKKLLTAVTTQIGKPVIFERGEIIHSTVLQGGRPVEQIRKDLESVVREARKVASSRGAKGKENRQPLTIMSRYVELPDGRKIYYYEEHMIDYWAQWLSDREEEYIVEAVAVVNTVEGEAVDADFRFYPNVMVFKRGDLLLTETFDGHASMGALFKKVLGTLEKLRSLASSKGMHGGAENRYGEISYEELFDVLDGIKRMHSLVALKVKVLEDTKAAGPLKIKLEFEKAKGVVKRS